MWMTSYNRQSPTRLHPPCSDYSLRNPHNFSWEACLCLVPSTTSVAASAMFLCNGELVGVGDEVPANTPPVLVTEIPTCLSSQTSGATACV